MLNVTNSTGNGGHNFYPKTLLGNTAANNSLVTLYSVFTPLLLFLMVCTVGLVVSHSGDARNSANGHSLRNATGKAQSPRSLGSIHDWDEDDSQESSGLNCGEAMATKLRANARKLVALVSILMFLSHIMRLLIIILRMTKWYRGDTDDHKHKHIWLLKASMAATSFVRYNALALLLFVVLDRLFIVKTVEILRNGADNSKPALCDGWYALVSVCVILFWISAIVGSFANFVRPVAINLIVIAVGILSFAIALVTVSVLFAKRVCALANTTSSVLVHTATRMTLLSVIVTWAALIEGVTVALALATEAAVWRVAYDASMLVVSTVVLFSLLCFLSEGRVLYYYVCFECHMLFVSLHDSGEDNDEKKRGSDEAIVKKRKQSQPSGKKEEKEEENDTITKAMSGQKAVELETVEAKQQAETTITSMEHVTAAARKSGSSSDFTFESSSATQSGKAFKPTKLTAPVLPPILSGGKAPTGGRAVRCLRETDDELAGVGLNSARDNSRFWKFAAEERIATEI